MRTLNRTCSRNALPRLTATLAVLTLGLGGCGMGKLFERSEGRESAPKALGDTPGSGRAVFGGEKADPNIVSYAYQTQYSYVRIERSEAPGQGGNSHPVALDPAQLRSALAKLKVKGGLSDGDPVFSDAELDEIVPPLVSALAKAKPGEDVTFAVSGKRGALGAIQGRSVTSARMFYRNGQLNVIFGLVHNPFEQQLQATGWLRPFTPGKRDAPLDASIAIDPIGARHAAAGRRDWVVFGEEALAAGRAGEPAGRAGTATPAPGAPAGAVAPAGTAPAQPLTTDTQYQEVERRLKVLNRLKENGLISEEEYREKRRAILKEF